MAILLFYQVARLIRDDHQYAMRCTLFLVLFPTSFFYLAIYAESLYLALAILTVYLLLRPRPRFILSGFVCGLASLARPVGWLFNLVTLVEWGRRRLFRWRTLLIVGVALSLSVVGVVLYVIYAYTLTGSWLAILKRKPWPATPMATSLANLWAKYRLCFVGQWDRQRLVFVRYQLGRPLFYNPGYRTDYRGRVAGLSPQKNPLESGCIPCCLHPVFISPARPRCRALWGMASWVGALFPTILFWVT
ncbi:MAG: hypothetical protein IPL78_22455 [Chloroflexi bacterium]|nr:hypothetical protein [Chloroflexota bacterium]